MYRCYARYLAADVGREGPGRRVVDVGGADVNGGYREIFSDPKFRYQTVDLSPGEGVDIVLEDPYRLPFDDDSIDVVLSGQMLEHCEFFWLTFSEMIRVLKPDGFLFLIAPSAGPIHSYPVDCYRFYPDAYRALAKHAGCHLLECWLDERGPWRDLVGVFSKAPRAASPASIPHVLPMAPTNVAPGTAEEEVVAGSVPYLEVLASIHERLKPELYLEIGVRRGHSLALATGAAIGIDPAPEVAPGTLPESTRVHAMASDDFFRDVAPVELNQAPDLAFIDGMHWFEFALRDFMNVERLAKPGSLVVLDDIYPSHPAQAERRRRTQVWTGDIWKLHACLAAMRPDLVLVALDTAPTGLLLVAGLDPANRVLWDSYNPTVRRYREESAPPADVLRRSGAWSPSDPRLDELLGQLWQARNSETSVSELRSRLRAWSMESR